MNCQKNKISHVHVWDKTTGIKKVGKPWIGLKSKWIRTCIHCGYKEEYNRGIFTGWFEYSGN
jgi:predicted nucleic-acid-binding Zn-ribbon protein